MLIAYWILAAVLALIFIASGSTKIARPKAALASTGMKYVEEFSGSQVKSIGAVEIVGAVGLVVPRLTEVASILAPIAALGLAALMAAAVAVHVRRQEDYRAPLALAVLSVVTALVGFLSLA
ncbi:DoxX family protein [Microbacterium yannicii]|uniref:DoxX family protein n=1 Tax=Microbacterium yannicii TaxID=671622 RepID=UPI000301EAD9|nr:DoxX family protein [Microbacterium yannicii]